MAQGGTSHSLRRLCRAACGLVAVIALVVFLGGWAAGWAPLRNLVPGTVGMKWQTAVGLLLAATALYLLIEPVGRGHRVAARGCATATLVFGLAVLGEYVFGWRLGVDELLFRDASARALGSAHPGRVAPMTAICLVLTGTALLTLDLPPRGRWRVAELAIAPVAVIGVLTVIGYLYAIPSFYGPASAAKMALGAGACFLLLAAGILIARPRGRLVTLATTDDPGGVMARRLLPVAIILPLLLGWARVKAGEAGLFGERAGTWWLSAVTVLAFTALIGRVAVRLSHYAQRGRELEAELVRLANHDALTGLYNRHRFDQELAEAVLRADRDREPCSVLIVDLDGMKEVNDGLGHAAGDQMLQAVAATFRLRLRAADVVGRIGGDEFGILLPATGEARARILAESLCTTIGALRVPTPAGEAVTTVSIGIAGTQPGGEDPEAVMARADDAMYRVKRAGGDGVAAARAPAAAG